MNKIIAYESGGIHNGIHQSDSRDAAQNAPTPVTTCALFYDGEYLTNEIMNGTRFMKEIERRQSWS